MLNSHYPPKPSLPSSFFPPIASSAAASKMRAKYRPSRRALVEPVIPKPPIEKHLLTKETEDEKYSDSDESDQSEEIIVFETADDIRQVNEMAVMKLSRLGHRETLFNSKISSYFVILAFLCTYDTMNTFSHYMGQHGEGFLLSYIFMMVLVGFPLLYMEMALGQYTSCNGYAVFDRMAGAMSGIGMASLIFNFTSLVNDQMLMSYFANLFFNTVNVFRSVMPWHTCSSSTNDASCRDFDTTCEEYQPTTRSPEMNRKLGLHYAPMGNICYRSKIGIIENSAQKEWSVRTPERVTATEWFKGETVGQHLFMNAEITKDSLNIISWPTFDFLVYTFLSLTVIYLICQRKGYITKLAKISCLITVIVFGTMYLIVFMTLPRRFSYMEMFDEDSENLVSSAKENLAMIATSALLVLKTLKLGQGGIIYFGSQHKFRNTLVKDCILICVVVTLVQMLYALCHGMVLDSYSMLINDGDMQKFNYIAKGQVEQEKTYTYILRTRHAIFDLAILVQSLRFYVEERQIIFIVSLMGTLITISSMIVRVEILVSTVTDSFPVISDTMSKKVVLHLTICLCSMFTFVLNTQTGFEIMIAFEQMMVPTLSGIIVLFQLFSVCYLYGPRRLLANIMTMNMRKNHEQESRLAKTTMNAIIIGLWCFVIPGILSVSVLAILSNGFHARGAHYFTDFPVMCTIGIISIIPVMGSKRIVDQYFKSSNVGPMLTPNRDLWGPRSSEDRKIAQKIEKMLRA